MPDTRRRPMDRFAAADPLGSCPPVSRGRSRGRRWARASLRRRLRLLLPVRPAVRCWAWPPPAFGQAQPLPRSRRSVSASVGARL